MGEPKIKLSRSLLLWINILIIMILILLGTIKLEFPRILNQVEHLIEKLGLQNKVIAQIGHTNYSGRRIKTLKFCSQSKLDHLISQSDIVITHAGTGSIMSSLQQKKK